jgi:hypothetical protein
VQAFFITCFITAIQIYFKRGTTASISNVADKLNENDATPSALEPTCPAVIISETVLVGILKAGVDMDIYQRVEPTDAAVVENLSATHGHHGQNAPVEVVSEGSPPDDEGGNTSGVKDTSEDSFLPADFAVSSCKIYDYFEFSTRLKQMLDLEEKRLGRSLTDLLKVRYDAIPRSYFFIVPCYV